MCYRCVIFYIFIAYVRQVEREIPAFEEEGKYLAKSGDMHKAQVMLTKVKHAQKEVGFQSTIKNGTILPELLYLVFFLMMSYKIQFFHPLRELWWPGGLKCPFSDHSGG